VVRPPRDPTKPRKPAVIHQRLSADGFLTELNRMFTKSKNSKSGSVQVIMKRYIPPAAPKDVPSQEGEGCLIHAKLKKRKVSSLVPYKECARFHRQFSTILKVHVPEGLKKAEKLSKKQKVTAAAAAQLHE